MARAAGSANFQVSGWALFIALVFIGILLKGFDWPKLWQ